MSAYTVECRGVDGLSPTISWLGFSMLWYFGLLDNFQPASARRLLYICRWAPRIATRLQLFQVFTLRTRPRVSESCHIVLLDFLRQLVRLPSPLAAGSHQVRAPGLQIPRTFSAKTPAARRWWPHVLCPSAPVTYSDRAGAHGTARDRRNTRPALCLPSGLTPPRLQFQKVLWFLCVTLMEVKYFSKRM